jgi:transposase
VQTQRLRWFGHIQRGNPQHKLTKKQLWGIINPKLEKHEKKYVIVTLLNKYGHDVLRLPPYQCQYNPIEIAWGVTKSYCNKHRKAMPSTKNVSDL